MANNCFEPDRLMQLLNGKMYVVFQCFVFPPRFFFGEHCTSSVLHDAIELHNPKSPPGSNLYRFYVYRVLSLPLGLRAPTLAGLRSGGGL